MSTRINASELSDIICQALSKVHEKKPLIDCITNFVTVNDCANIILAAGASPSMAEDIREVAETAAGSAALVCNLGAINRVDEMIIGSKSAMAAGNPIVLDPVAAGDTSLRRRESAMLLENISFSVIRGNASEIKALAHNTASGSGVDVSAADAISEDTLPEAIKTARLLAEKTAAVIAVSGPIDIITDGTQTVLLRNGCSTMSRITGSGCMLTALIGAFCGAMHENIFEAAVSACAVMDIAGELADERRIKNGTGNASFRTDLIDAVFNMDKETIKSRLNGELI